jgi:hypothetical protein
MVFDYLITSEFWPIIISLKINLFLPWYIGKIVEVSLNNNHSLTDSLKSGLIRGMVREELQQVNLQWNDDRPEFRCNEIIKYHITVPLKRGFKATFFNWLIQLNRDRFINILILGVRVRDLVFNATFNNISVISWWSVLLVEETRVPGENHWPASSHWQTFSHNVVSSTPHFSNNGKNIYGICLEMVQLHLFLQTCILVLVTETEE